VTKFVVVLSRRPDLSVARFEEVLAGEHAAMAEALPGLRHYVQNRAAEDPTRPRPAWDAVVELWWDDRAAMEAAWKSEAGRRATEHLADFVDLSRTTWGIVEERVRSGLFESRTDRLAGGPESEKTRPGPVVECVDPILAVDDMARSVRYYVDVLGFEPAPWGTDDFTRVARDGRGLYLCRRGQGRPGAWIWVGVADARALFETYRARGAIVRQPPEDRPWGLEMQIEDPDGNVLRFGSDRETA
jgi:uncharacterized protein (TIGR02118 family)